MDLRSVLILPVIIPPELLCEIFMLLSFRDRVQATHVCKYWRNAALNHIRALWSDIRSQGARSGAFGDQLARTRSVPVDVAVLLKNSTLDEAMSAISNHLHHIRSLVLYTVDYGEGAVSMENIHYAYSYLARPAPMLEELDIALDVPDYHPDTLRMRDPWERWMRRRILCFDYTLNADLFAGHAPRLRQAAWLVMELNPNGCAALSYLTRFAFEGRRLSTSHLSVIVNFLPQLKCLLLDIQDFEGLPDCPPSESFRLEELFLHMPETDSREGRKQDILPVLKYLGYHEIARVTTYRFENWLERFTAAPRGMPHTIHIDYAGGLPFWHMVASNGFISRALYLWITMSDLLVAPLGIRLRENLERFVIETSFMSRHSPFPPFPRLSHLTLRIRDTLPSTTRSEPSMHCPALQVMEIWWDTEDPPSAADVSQGLVFCLQSVSYRSDSPISVVIRGADSVPVSEDHPQTAYTLTMLQEPVPDSFIAERTTRWHVVDTEYH